MQLSLRLLVGLPLLGCSEAPQPAAPPRVILITLDTLRADHLGCYGHEGASSPNLDAFAAGATLFEDCWSTAPWTAPAHASLFTGLHPFEHGTYSFEVDRQKRNVHPLSEEAVTLAEALHAAGLATAGIAANTVYLDERYQLGQGFQLWDVQREHVNGIHRRALAWLEERREEPFFLFLNFMDTHRPYNVTPRDGEREFDEPSGALLNRLIEQVMEQGEDPDPALVAEIKAQYERAVRNLDAGLGELFEDLRGMGLWDDTLIVITSDHGEYFGEHGLVEHSKDVYGPALRIPLMVKYPRQEEGTRQGGLVSGVDVPRLILAGLPGPLRSRLEEVFPYSAGDHPVVAENHFSRSKDLLNPIYGKRFRRVRQAIHEGNYKYIHSSDGAHELYKLDVDPQEARNLVEDEPERARNMAELLARFQEVGRERPKREVIAGEMTAEELEEMQALGYSGDGE